MNRIVRTTDEGERRWFYGGGVHIWKLTSEQTGGAVAMFEDRLARGKTTPLHRHPDHDELIYVLEGEILIHAGDGQRPIGAGGMVFNGRGVEHAFVVVSETARLLCINTPGTSETFYRAASEPAGDQDGPVDFARIAEVAAQTGVTDILGPPPFRR